MESFENFSPAVVVAVNRGAGSLGLAPATAAATAVNEMTPQNVALRTVFRVPMTRKCITSILEKQLFHQRHRKPVISFAADGLKDGCDHPRFAGQELAEAANALDVGIGVGRIGDY